MAETRDRPGGRHWLALAVGVAIAVAIRALLLSQPGLSTDGNDFLAWARAINANGLGHTYDQPVSFPPILPWIWWLLGSAAPGLLNPTPNDLTALVLIRVPAMLADLGIAAVIGWILRDRPSWAVVAVLGVLLHPAVVYVSALWPQLESIYVLPMLVAWLCAVRRRPGWAAVAVAVSLMTKPQALPLIVPFAAWFLATGGWRGAGRALVIGLTTVVVLWLPFLTNDGPARYLGILADFSANFAILSLRAWNPWWILQSVAGGGFVSDGTAVMGSITFRWIGIGIAGALELLVFVLVWRRRTAESLAWGVTAAALVSFVGLTEMHERYAYPALIFLTVLFPDRRAVALWVALGIVYTLNLLASVPPTAQIGAALAVDGWLGIVGSMAMTAITVGTLVALWKPSPDLESPQPPAS